MELLQALNWRYATKKMTGDKISDDKLETILEAIRLAPTSLGLQPFECWVIQDIELRKKLTPLCFNQPQIEQSSALLIFTVWTENFEQKAEKHIQNMAQTRGLDISSLEGYRSMCMDFLNSHTNEQKKSWAEKQAYIALGFGLAAAALLQVDSTPMEGFQPQAVDELLGLKKLGLASTVMLALGIRDEQNDTLAHQKKVRRKKEDFFRML